MKQINLRLGVTREVRRDIPSSRALSNADPFVEGPSVWTGRDDTPFGSDGCPGCLPECPDCPPIEEQNPDCCFFDDPDFPFYSGFSGDIGSGDTSGVLFDIPALPNSTGMGSPDYQDTDSGTISLGCSVSNQAYVSGGIRLLGDINTAPSSDNGRHFAHQQYFELFASNAATTRYVMFKFFYPDSALLEGCTPSDPDDMDLWNFQYITSHEGVGILGTLDAENIPGNFSASFDFVGDTLTLRMGPFEKTIAFPDSTMRIGMQYNRSNTDNSDIVGCDYNLDNSFQEATYVLQNISATTTFLSECTTLVPDPSCAGYANLEAVYSGSNVWEIPYPDPITIDHVYFDDLPAIEGEHYTVINNGIVPNTPLSPETIVRARYSLGPTLE